MPDIKSTIEKVKKKKKFSRGRRPDRPDFDQKIDSNSEPPDEPSSEFKNYATQSPNSTKKNALRDLGGHLEALDGAPSEHDNPIIQNSSETLQKQYGNKTKNKHIKNNKKTDTTQSNNTKDTVSKHRHNTSLTDGLQTRNIKSSVDKQCGIKSTTIDIHSKNSNKTNQEQYINIDDTFPKHLSNVSNSEYEHSQNNRYSTEEQTQNKKDSYLLTEQKQNIDTLDVNSVSLKLKSLGGTKLELLTFLCKECINNGSNRIEKISYTYISNVLQKPLPSTKTIFGRLKKLKLFEVESFQKGPGATINIILNDSTIKAFSRLILDQSKYVTIQKQNNNITSLNTETPSSSSSSITIQKNLNTITIEMSEDWMAIQTPEVIKDIGFGSRQVKALFNKGVLSSDEVQESLVHFGYDLDNGFVKASIGPLNLLMGVLIKGDVYVSEAFVEAMRVERKKRQALKAEFEELKREQAALELSNKFEEYRKNLNQQQINELVPPTKLIGEGSNFQMMLLKEKWEEQYK